MAYLALIAVVSLLAALPCDGRAQEGPARRAATSPDSTVDASSLTLYRVVDGDSSLQRFLADSGARRRETLHALLALVAGEAGGCGDDEAYVWLVRAAAPDDGPEGPELADRVHRLCDGRIVDGDRLYEADRLLVLAVLPQRHIEAGAASSGLHLAVGDEVAESDSLEYRVEARVVAQRAAGQLAEALPAFLSRVLPGLLRSVAGVRRAPRPLATYDVGVHSTVLAFDDATVGAQVEIAVAAGLDAADLDGARDALAEAAVDVKLRNVSYGEEVDAVHATIDSALDGCTDTSHERCRREIRDALAELADELRQTAEYRVRAVQGITTEMLTAVEAVLTLQPVEVARTFRVVDRPFVSFSVGGAVTDAFSDDVTFDVEDGELVPDDGSSGFAALAFVDVYGRRVDLEEGAAGWGVQPHLSVGLALDDDVRPGLFLATTLPKWLRRLAVFGGFMPRREAVEDDEADGDEADTDFPFVWGLKVRLPF